MSRFTVLFALLLLPARPALSGPIRDRLDTLAALNDFGAVYDGSRSGGSAVSQMPDRAADAALVPPIRDEESLRQAKALLSDGTGEGDAHINPFVFRPANSGTASAPSSGLEGFVYEQRQLAASQGDGALAGQLDDYGRYLDALLAPVSWTDAGRRQIQQILSGSGAPIEKYGKLMAFVAQYTEELRAAVAAADQAAWARKARIYEIFPRAYNLDGKRAAQGIKEAKSFFADFQDRDIAAIKGMGFDTLWVMGIFPIGKRGQSGTAGGSPYSISDFETVNPDLGTLDEFKAFVARAHHSGMRVITDFVINHTSLDSKLLAEDPTYFVSRLAGDGPAPNGTFDDTAGSGQKYWVNHGGYEVYGSMSFWIDTAQIDYSNPKLRRRMIGIVDRWAGDWGVDGFRVDMAYLVLNRYFSHDWGRQMPKREFLEELITEIKGKHPGTAFIAEAYDGWDDLSRAGFDLVYSKNSMDRPGGHTGWYDALKSRDPSTIRGAIRREAFLDWQEGGSEGLAFTGNHDEDSPERAFGQWMEGATFLTLLQPGSLLFYGSAEIGFDAAVPTEGKPLPFSVPVKIDWSHPDAEAKRFHDETFKLAREVHAALGPSDMEALPLGGEPPWVGYLLVSRDPKGLKAAAVIVNPTGQDAAVQIDEPRLGIHYRGTLPALSYRLVRF